MRYFLYAALAALLAYGPDPATAGSGSPGAKQVDLALVLLVDASSSIKDDEFKIQLEGYASAFRHPDVINAIRRGGPNKRIAVTLATWSSRFKQRQVLDWTFIDGPESAHAFARATTIKSRQFRSATAIGDAINFGIELLENTPFDALRRVIDISGDEGKRDGSIDPEDARARATARSIIINGLVMRDTAGGNNPVGFYRKYVVTEHLGFVEVAENIDDFPRAVRRKIVLEIAGISPAIAQFAGAR